MGLLLCSITADKLTYRQLEVSCCFAFYLQDATFLHPAHRRQKASNVVVLNPVLKNFEEILSLRGGMTSYHSIIRPIISESRTGGFTRYLTIM